MSKPDIVREFSEIKEELRAINKNITTTAKKLHYTIKSMSDQKTENVKEKEQVKEKEKKTRKNNTLNGECSGLVFEDPPATCPETVGEDNKLERMLWQKKKIIVCHKCKLAHGRHKRKLKKQQQEQQEQHQSPSKKAKVDTTEKEEEQE